jgi:DNA invertase Pin-like site-specific DNA recombinase
MKSKQSNLTPAVAYYRVSTARQGASGLGLEAQRKAVADYCARGALRIVEGFQDVESGRHNSRPGFDAALAKAKAEGAVLVIAKLDRLSRNASFTMALRDSGVRFVAADMPEANTMTIGLMAVMAQDEAERTSSRTRAALAALKARGVKLGSPRNNLTDATRAKAAKAKREEARTFHNGSIKHALNYRRMGWTLRQIAEALNAAGATTRKGKAFQATTVARLLKLGAAGEVYGDATAEDIRDAESVRRAFARARGTVGH